MRAGSGMKPKGENPELSLLTQSSAAGVDAPLRTPVSSSSCM